MGVKQQIDDAIFLFENGRYIGGLTNALLAAAGSSRKMFPKATTKSIKYPGKEMGDGEAFELFLRTSDQRAKFEDGVPLNAGHSMVALPFRGKQLTIEHILYKYYRCHLAHQSELPSDVEFDPSHNGNGARIDFQDNKLILDAGWLKILIDKVVNSPVNGPEFGITHYGLDPVAPNEEEFKSLLCEKRNITPGHFEILQLAARALSPEKISQSNDQMLKRDFKDIVQREVINGGMLGGLRSRQIVNDSFDLTDRGAEILREVAAGYKLVRIS
ncbi:hypothetical protein [Massilia luteola]|uniref:hypothetical protein n=1 Tax=Massilia luteola TaxID=3081751 RepID=UPI002ACBF063|nr:hypothetical protein [Massilia sp. Gc5]